MIWPFRKKQPSVPRRKLDVETVRMLLDKRIAENKQVNFKAYWTKSTMALATVKDVEDASAKSFSPWQKERWECEDIARSLIDAAQRKAANEGCSLAIGIVFADPPGRFQDSERHVYVWIVSGQGIDFYDPTARRWCECPQNIYFSLL